MNEWIERFYLKLIWEWAKVLISLLYQWWNWMRRRKKTKTNETLKLYK